MRGTYVELVFLIAAIIAAILIGPSNQFEESKQQPQSIQQPSTIVKNHSDTYEVEEVANGSNTNASSSESRNYFRTPSTSGSTMTVKQFRSSIPMRIYECLRDFSTLRCTKLFVLQKLEERKNWTNTGNLTKDFLQQFFGEEEKMGSLISEKFRKLSDKELNKKLVVSLQRFFKNRDIKLQFLPGLMVKVVPSKDNKMKLSFKKKNKHKYEGRAQDTSLLVGALKDQNLLDSSLEGHGNLSLEDEEGDGKSKHKVHKKKIKKDKTSYKTTILQMAVPVMMMPAILMGTFLPFILPVLKMATLTTMIMNNTAFMAALIYAARTHVNAQQEQPISYNYGSHPIGYH
ncbi:uncharacterized protein LOC133335556 [Musca vetustissima]|uniref:uncharacterized protein LOC133335556 n=1 Tax=Musca vetustissima TaxID=27455 RepID=UPI002AB78929|nr:uncharacterized protein LOC133335556 [Musca vetustissima]